MPPYTGQFDRLNVWLMSHVDTLFDTLGGGTILFGEWCAVRHSLGYSRLPDWFLGFDAYDRNVRKFVSTRRRDELLLRAGLESVSRVDAGHFTFVDLERLLSQAKSAYRRGSPEGFYLRVEEDDWLIGRAKIVRPEFTHAIGSHWRHHATERNRMVATT